MRASLPQERIQRLAATAPEYRFGSPELDVIHAKRDRFGRYTEHQVYVVHHPAVNGGCEHWTLNMTCVGQVVPAMFDIEK